MLLVVGGIAAGKRTYVQAQGFAPTDLSNDLWSEAPVLVGLEELLRDGPLDEAAWQALLAKQVVICCEVGLGVVPLDPDERAWRELVGRTCAALATEADHVIRLVCGIPQILKSSATVQHDEAPVSTDV